MLNQKPVFLKNSQVRLGWRWENDKLVFRSAWRKEERDRGMTGLQKTLEVIKGMMNSVCNFLTLTMESEDDFAGELPTLDITIWVDANNKTMFKFFQKPMCSNLVLQRRSAMPENMRI